MSNNISSEVLVLEEVSSSSSDEEDEDWEKSDLQNEDKCHMFSKAITTQPQHQQDPINGVKVKGEGHTEELELEIYADGEIDVFEYDTILNYCKRCWLKKHNVGECIDKQVFKDEIANRKAEMKRRFPEYFSMRKMHKRRGWMRNKRMRRAAAKEQLQQKQLGNGGFEKEWEHPKEIGMQKVIKIEQQEPMKIASDKDVKRNYLQDEDKGGISSVQWSLPGSDPNKTKKTRWQEEEDVIENYCIRCWRKQHEFGQCLDRNVFRDDIAKRKIEMKKRFPEYFSNLKKQKNISYKRSLAKRKAEARLQCQQKQPEIEGLEKGREAIQEMEKVNTVQHEVLKVAPNEEDGGNKNDFQDENEGDMYSEWSSSESDPEENEKARWRDKDGRTDEEITAAQYADDHLDPEARNEKDLMTLINAMEEHPNPDEIDICHFCCRFGHFWALCVDRRNRERTKCPLWERGKLQRHYLYCQSSEANANKLRDRRKNKNLRRKRNARLKKEKELLVEAEQAKKNLEERERLQREAIERENLKKQRLEEERKRLQKEKKKREAQIKKRLEQEQRQREILARKERFEKEQMERERLQLERDRLVVEHFERERLERERLQQELLERERLERERDLVKEVEMEKLKTAQELLRVARRLLD